MIETYESDDFQGFTLSDPEDGYPAGPTDAYMAFDTFEEAVYAAERL